MPSPRPNLAAAWPHEDDSTALRGNYIDPESDADDGAADGDFIDASLSSPDPGPAVTWDTNGQRQPVMTQMRRFGDALSTSNARNSNVDDDKRTSTRTPPAFALGTSSLMASQMAIDLSRHTPQVPPERGLAASFLAESLNAGSVNFTAAAAASLLVNGGAAWLGASDRTVTAPHAGDALGKGAAGTVTLEWDGELKAWIAIKTVRARDALRQDAAKRELAFAARYAAVRGAEKLPNIVPVLRCTRHADGNVTIASVYMPHGSAADLVASAEPCSLQRLAAIGHDVLRGLDSLHRLLGFVHRDLKPANILFGADHAAYLADFGSSASVTDAFDQIGTLSQMSPERLRGDPHGAPSDVWALGLTLAELAAKSHPFQAALLHSTDERFWRMVELLHVTAADPQETEDAVRALIDQHMSAHGCHAALCDFVAQCTASDPSCRPTVDALLSHPLLRLRADGCDNGACPSCYPATAARAPADK